MEVSKGGPGRTGLFAAMAAAASATFFYLATTNHITQTHTDLSSITSIITHISSQNFQKLNEIPAYTVLSEKIGKDLKQKGFRFVGPTVVYSYMQAIGMVNDHLESCFRHSEVILKR